MPIPVPAWSGSAFPTAKSLNLAIYSSDGTADNPTGVSCLAYRPLLFESYTRTTTFPGASGGTQVTMSTSGSITSCQVVCDTAGYFGQASDLPGIGYYQLTSVIEGAAGDGVTPGGWMVASHFVPLKPTATQTSVSADLLQVGGTVTAGSRQAPNTANDSCPFFCDLVNVGTSTWQPAVTIRDSGGSATTNAVNSTDSSGETPRFYAVWAAVSATTSGQATFTVNGSYSFTAPPGVTSVTASPTGAGGGGGAGNVSAGGIEYGGGGPGGGESASGAVAVTPGNSYPVTVGAAGAEGTSPGGNGSAGGNSAFSGDAVTVTAHGGSAGAGATTSADGAAGPGGTGSSAPTHHDGGAGAAGTTAVSGGGGGSSAGTGAAGSAAMGADGGDAPAGGGPGGDGGTVAITVVQSASGGGSGNTFTLKFAKAIQAGNGVIACVNYQGNNAGTDPNVKLNDGTPLDQQTSADVTLITDLQCGVYGVFGVTGGQTSVTVTGSGTKNQAVCIQMWEVAGLGASPNVDASNSASQGGGKTDVSKYSVSAPTTQAPDFWVGMAGGQQLSSFSIHPPSGSWTVFGSQASANHGGVYSRVLAGYQVKSATGTMTYKGTFSKNVSFGAIVVAWNAQPVTTGTSPLLGPGGGGGGGFGTNDGAAGYDGAVTLTWTGVSGSGYGTPPLPAPYTAWGPGTRIGTAGDLNIDVDINGPMGITDVVNFLSNPPVFRISSAAATSISNATLTDLAFSGVTPTVDSYGGWSAGTYTVQRDGLYLLHGLTCFAQAASGTRQAGVTVNGTTYWGPGYTPASSGGTHATKTQILSLVAGDTVQLACRQDSGSSVTLSTASATRFFLAWLCESGLPVQEWAPPDTTFRWASGTPGPAVPALFQQHLANDLGFLVNRPYLMAYQSLAQSGLTVGAFSTVTLDTVGGLVHGDNGDNYGGWSPGPSNAYTAQTAGWYLLVGEYFSTSSAASGATVVAGIQPSTSGGVAPLHAVDLYQSLTATATASVGGGGTILGLQYMGIGESVAPVVEALSFAAPYGTLAGTSNGGVYASHLGAVWISS